MKNDEKIYFNWQKKQKVFGNLTPRCCYVMIFMFKHNVMYGGGGKIVCVSMFMREGILRKEKIMRKFKILCDLTCLQRYNELTSL